MNRISRRTYFVFVLALILLVGVGAFTVKYFLHCGQWATYPRNELLFAKEITTDFQMFDRDGVLLYRSAEKQYAEDAYLRKAVLHLTGDKPRNIPSVALDYYRDNMVGYNPITGLHYSDSGTGVEYLTVSADAQTTALSKLDGRRGCVGVYNYKTGEILCAVSSSTFDPCDPPSNETIETSDYYNGVYTNRFFSRSYTPGSIFKLVTATAVIENISGYGNKTWHCSGSLDISGGTVTCSSAHGDLTLEQALAKSCNCAFAQMALDLGADVLEDYAKQAGIVDSIFVDGYETKKGNFDLSGASSWDVAWAGIGQGSGKHNDMINPCQYMTFMGAIANGGRAAKPYLVSQVENDGSVTYTASTKNLSKAIEETTAKKLKKMMRNNTLTMYGAITVPDVCAKSGTAEVSMDGSVANTATFTGFIDNDTYPLAFIVIVEEGGSGSQAAAPIANDVLWACMNAMDNE
ncbi:MAG: penicillin-binding protein [Clostridia bacterium]|nr:penicillin-binding protein [Clostridia bacterium]